MTAKKSLVQTENMQQSMPLQAAVSKLLTSATVLSQTLN
jgi:hypothetical protein